MAITQDNTKQAIEKARQCAKRAAVAMGTEAVGQVVKQMEKGYSDPHPNKDRPGSHTAIRDTGALMQDVHYKVDEKDRDNIQVTIGNSLQYAPYVFYGTSRLKGRHYLTDGINNGWDKIQSVYEQEMKK